MQLIQDVPHANACLGQQQQTPWLVGDSLILLIMAAKQPGSLSFHPNRSSSH
jgi:hypothetical protein